MSSSPGSESHVFLVFYPKENSLAVEEQHPGMLHKDVRASGKIQCGKRQIELLKEFVFFLVFVWIRDFSPPGSRSITAGAV